ncbi:cytochrome b [Bosea sp. PAMC 26642]|uniref:cytochrome b n=1 Tax=Bosea sp. (strain PAMC 26642) TaxID=1792307 RepID=UPI0007700EF0|nr:cytochrome b/b6 domain-containing protein [Bosea sp. PAMC 26642]AMJ60358.1 hypothetical protein AXW83_08685 [Bosea sp. PAMC 26642]
MTMTVVPEPQMPARMTAASTVPMVRAFPRVSVVLHWLIAVMVLAMFASGVMMKQIGEGALADQLYTFHKTSGASILVLVIVRLIYRAAVHLAGRWSPGAGSRGVHAVLYLGLILVPLLGWAGISDYGARAVYFGLSLPAIWPEGAGYDWWLFKSHAVLAFLLVACVAIHIGLALGDYIERGGNRASFPAEPREPDNSASPAGPDMP